MQPGLENIEKRNSFMNKTTFLKVHHSRHHSPRHHSRHSFETSQVSANLPGSQFFPISIITRMTSAVVSSLGIIAVSIGTALVGIFCTFVNVYKTVYGQSMVIFIKGITHEN